ncbi:ABC transporter permease [Modestobacter caceresii]|uniref:ABC transporter permease n=1 Tax=Modestobacter caceresii TaxID=1522368 RepID=UPI00068CB710|nr:ABC transporter permease subunit [Modestobacter caceresii]
MTLGARRLLPGLALLLLAAWFVLPLVPLALWGLADRWSAPAVLPQEWGLSGVAEAAEQGAGSGVVGSLALGGLVAMLATPLGALAGRALASRHLPASVLVGAVLLSPLVVPPFVVAMGFDVLLLRLAVPAWAGVVLLLTVAALPYTTYVMRTAYGGYDQGFDDEARTLGASPRQVVRLVQVPVLTPALAAAAFLAFLVGWSDYVVTVLVGGGRLVTLPLLVASATSAVGNEAQVAALSLLAVLPPLALLLIVAAIGRRGRKVRA